MPDVEQITEFLINSNLKAVNKDTGIPLPTLYYYQSKPKAIANAKYKTILKLITYFKETV